MSSSDAKRARPKTGTQSTAKASPKHSTTPDKVTAKKESKLKAQNDETEKDHQIKALQARILYLESNLDIQVFQKTVGIEEQGLIGILQNGLKSAEEELVKLRQGLASPNSSTEELRQAKEEINKLQKDIMKKESTIADINSIHNKAKNELEEMRKKQTANRSKINALSKSNIDKDKRISGLERENNRLYRDIPNVLAQSHKTKAPKRNTSAKSRSSDDTNSDKLATLEKEKKEKDTEIASLTRQVISLEATIQQSKESVKDGSQTITSKDTEIASLKELIKSLENTIQQSKDSHDIAVLTKTLETKDHEIATHKAKVKEVENAMEELRKQKEEATQKHQIDIKQEREARNAEIERLQKEKNSEVKQKEEAIQQHQDELMVIRKDLEEKDSKLQQLQEDKNSEEELKKKYMKTVEELERNQERSKSAKDRNDSMHSLIKDKDAEIKNKTEEIEKLKNKNKELEKSCHDAFEKLESKDKEKKKLENEFKSKLESKDDTINKLRREKSMEVTAPERTKVDDIQKELRKATQEIDELKSRLSKMVGENLAHNNPNITDLSDENRPTKLAETYSEIYDNEWTDAYEELENQGSKEVAIIQQLLQILQDAENFSGRIAKRYLDHLQESASKLEDSQFIKGNEYKKEYLLKELRKHYAPSLVNQVFSLYVKDRKLNLVKTPKVEEYAKSCIKLCWLMSVQDPRVVLDWVKVPGAFDSDRYRTYTKSGTTMEYVVWPTLLLHAEGPILMKGVAQGK